MDNTELKRIAARILADYDAVIPGGIFAEGLRLDIADAWQVQTAVTQLRESRGERVIGYKIGCVDLGNQKMMGLTHPVWGRLWNTELHKSTVQLEKKRYSNIALEAEFGVTLKNGLSATPSETEIAEAIEALYPVLELHNLTLHSEAPRGHELIAVNAINCGVVRGDAITDLAHAQATDLKLIFDDDIVDSWESLHWPTDIIKSISWLTERFKTGSLTLKPGDLILTGAWGPPIPVGNYRHTQLTSSSFGNVSATFI